MNATLLQALKAAIDSALGQFLTCLPGEIVSYDSTIRKASVRSLLRVPLPTGEFMELPVMTGVPVLWPSVGSGRLRFPLHEGDAVLLLFSSRSLDTWAVNTGVTTPQDARSQSFSDAIAIPGLWSFASLSDPEQDGLELYYDGKVTIRNGDVSLVIDGDQIEAAGTGALALADHIHDVQVVGAAMASPPTPVTTIVGASNSNTSKLKGG